MSDVQNEFSFDERIDSVVSSRTYKSKQPHVLSGAVSVRSSGPKPDLPLPAALDEKPNSVAASPVPAVLFLSDKDVALRYSVSRPTVWRWIKDKYGFPAPIKIAEGTSRWHLRDLEAYERNRASLVQEPRVEVSDSRCSGCDHRRSWVVLGR